jgi:hypothetical protein
MLLTMLFAALSLAPAASSPLRPMDRSLTSTPDCPNARGYHASEEPARLRPRRLGELPPGRLELTVLRGFDGCPIPAVLRENIGGVRAPDARAPGRR